jgi:ACS family glucarate transporter-like MFS transporter/ACS family D-galactonate transporter-like MFS transporter
MGLLVDRWGARRAMFLFGMMGAITLALGAGTLVLGATLGFFVLFTSRALMGVAQAGLFPASTRCIATWFPLRRRAFATGTLQAFMSIGGACGAIVAGFLIVRINWPWVFVILAIPGVAWAVWFYLWYRDRPEEHASVNAAERVLLQSAQPANDQAHGSTGPTPWLQLAADRKLLWLCASQFFRASAIVFWIYSCPTFLQKVYDVPKDESGYLTSIPFIGVVLGSLGGGILSDRVLASTGSKRLGRNGVAIVTAAIGVVLFLLAFLVHAGPYVAIGIMFVAALFTAGANPCAYSVSIDIGGRFMMIVFGAMNMIGNFGSAAFPQFILYWTRYFGWAAAPLLMAALYGIGVVCWFFVDPNGTVLEKRQPIEPID